MEWFLLFSQESEAIAQSFADVLLQKIRDGCPEYLCKDLVLTGTRLSCSSGGDSATFHAQAGGFRVEESVEIFLASLKDPLMLNINGSIDILVTSAALAPRQGPEIGRVVGPSGGGGFLVIIVAGVVVVGAVWHW